MTNIGESFLSIKMRPRFFEKRERRASAIFDCIADRPYGQTRRTEIPKCSLGMKQRIGIAMALLGDPALLILDEPIHFCGI